MQIKYWQITSAVYVGKEKLQKAGVGMSRWKNVKLRMGHDLCKTLLCH